MPTAYKSLGQVEPSATTLTTLYTVPGATAAIASTLAVCNKGVATTFRVALRVGGGAVADKDYIVYDAPIVANDTRFLTIGLTASATDVVSVYAGTADVSFNLSGSEIS